MKGTSEETDGGDGNTVNRQPSFESVLQLYHKKIYNFSYRLLNDPDDAADLTQETFINAYKAFNRFRGPSDAIYPWLCRIAVNGCKNKFKSMSRRNRYEAWSLDETLDETDQPYEIGDESANPAEIIERRDLEEQVQEAIQTLPPEYRVVVVLRDMQGLSYKEVADVTGFSLDIVKVRLFRGRAILRRRFAPLMGK